MSRWPERSERPTSRICRSCETDKPLEAFYEDDRVKRDGRRSRCMDCLSSGRPPGPVPLSPLDRYVADDRGCWLWTGSVRKDGYGSVKWQGISKMAHRVVYELLIGPIPPGKLLDHLCSVKRCVNPDHLEPVTHRQNTQRAWDRRHCETCRCSK